MLNIHMCLGVYHIGQRKGKMYFNGIISYSVNITVQSVNKIYEIQLCSQQNIKEQFHL